MNVKFSALFLSDPETLTLLALEISKTTTQQLATICEPVPTAAVSLTLRRGNEGLV